MTAQQIISHLKSLENVANQEGMKRYAIGNDNTLGIGLPVLRNLAKTYKKVANRHSIAKELWDSTIHEAMILSGMVADPKLLTKEEMDAMTHQFYSWDLCDQTCNNLFQKTDFFIEKAFEYSHSDKEFVKRTGFVLMVQYAVHHKKSNDDLCIRFLKRMEEESSDARNFVRKAVNWCLRQIGKRNAYLHPIALEAAYRILEQDTPSAKWIARDAIRELENEKIIKRLK
ncbi:MAG: DNA alkylation repair protein [Bacteroidetes bacterium]|nr:DNA alkylation repair protein [Bacteroidota bacterium]MBK8144203.1 DNA alkylation repair protein [Bacteroidota bacterium]MBP6316320.1 DNA alkylation repair protein [Chitinophagaceae bacterium]